MQLNSVEIQYVVMHLSLNLKSIDSIDDCNDTSDCNDNGECIDIQATGFPTKQCFCDPGWFGRDCSRSKKKLLHILNVIPNTIFYMYVPI